jgi:hypothetical protein
MEWGDLPVGVKDGGAVGRILTSKRTILPGEILFTCRSTAIAVDAQAKAGAHISESVGANKYCFWCGKKSEELPLQCSSCDVRFCLSCASGKEFHSGFECALISQYEKETDSPLVRQGILAVRLIFLCNKHTFGENMSIYDLVGEAANCDETRKELAAALMQASSSDTCREHFPSEGCDFSEQKLLLTLDIMHRNAFKCNNIITVFPQVSFMNHSCSPNSIATVGYETGSDGSSFLMASVRALKTLAVDEEVTISYYPLGINPTEIRQSVIESKFGFLCACESCSLCEVENADKILLEQHETHFGDMELTLEPLLEVFESIEEEMEAVTMCVEESSGGLKEGSESSSLPSSVGGGETSSPHNSVGSDVLPEEFVDKFEDLDFLFVRAKAGIDNLKLGEFHYLKLKNLVMSAESCMLQEQKSDVIKYCDEWLRLIKSAPFSIQVLCDVHLRSRMLVIRAECLSYLFLSKTESAILGKTKKSKNKVLQSIDEAINLVVVMYGEDYALCQLLMKQRIEVSEAPSLDTD